MLDMRHVKDFSGKLIPRDKARSIDGYYYEEGKTCILMPDGQWYRTVTDKIRFDWETNKWRFSKDCLDVVKGLVDDGTIGYFTPTEENVRIAYKKDTFVKQVKLDIFGTEPPTEVREAKNTWIKTFARNAEIATKYGFVESIYDGVFYKEEEMSIEDKMLTRTPNTPQGERTNIYSLEDDQNKQTLVDKYNAYNPTISKNIRALASYVPYTFGSECETAVGFVPGRLRNKLGVRPLRDGSIAGIEYVTIPLVGAKGINTLYELFGELTKRTSINLNCSLHFHFGNVRRDKLYILALWSLAEKIQSELLSIFPFSRLNSIRPDGKVYCKALPNLGLNLTKLFKTKNREEFQKIVIDEFNKIYGFLNEAHRVGEIQETRKIKKEKTAVLGGKETRVWRLETKIYCFSTKNKAHSIRGHKWDRPQRYYWLNLLPTFFSKAETIEFRPHEATTNFERSIMWLLICVSILEYAKNIKECITASKITLEQVLKSHLPNKVAEHILKYCNERYTKFHKIDGVYRSGWENIENAWITEDRNYKFNNQSILDLW